MGEFRAGPHSEEYVEEKTEPFSQSEIHARMQSIRVEAATPTVTTSVPLDNLVVPPDKDIRILVRPLTRSRSVSPGSQDNCEWLALHAEVAEQVTEQDQQPQHKVLAVTQTSRDIKFSVRIPAERLEEDNAPQPPLWCELYYDPTSDNQILVNRSDLPITLSRVSHHPDASPGREYEVNPGSTKALVPGTWRIKASDAEVLDFRILEKRPVTYRYPSTSSSEASTSSDMVNSSGKRSFHADKGDPAGPERKLRATDSPSKSDDGVIMFLRHKADPLVFPLPTAPKGKELAPTPGHPLLDLHQDDMVEIPGGWEMDQYTITKGAPIAQTTQSAVYIANHSNVPQGTIVVKVLKTRPVASAQGVLAKPQENERNVIRQADTWLREFQNHSRLEHAKIARLYGGDARFLSLYMQHVEARDLSAWTDKADFFKGDLDDAVRILRDVAGALQYIHNHSLVHNDLKPGNILYSREGGAMLCDFGMATPASNPTTGGTPYYVPPEFIGLKSRGAPGDVWALGITMLFVLRKIVYPDSLGRPNHPRRLYWQIAQLNQQARYSRGGQATPSAVSYMKQWLAEVNEARSKLNRHDQLERTVWQMLAPQPKDRINMRQVMREFTTKTT